MLRKMGVFLLYSFLLGSMNTQAGASGPYGSIEVGKWKGGAYTNDNTGAFSHCAVGAPAYSHLRCPSVAWREISSSAEKQIAICLNALLITGYVQAATINLDGSPKSAEVTETTLCQTSRE
jgi:hypothetical protein